MILPHSELFLPILESDKISHEHLCWSSWGLRESSSHPCFGLMGITGKTQAFRPLFLSDPQMADDDSFFYLGTTTGDILKMNPRTKLLADTGPAKDKFSLVSRDHRRLSCPALFWQFLPSTEAQTCVKSLWEKKRVCSVQGRTEICKVR